MDDACDMRWDLLEHDLAIMQDDRVSSAGSETPKHDDTARKPAQTDETWASINSRLKLGRFEIRSELGRGGHGIVYLARDTVLQRDVALKVPRPETLASPELRQRFLLESRTVAELIHPGIVPVYDVGDLGPACYIASQFVSGPTLQEWLKRRTGPVPIRLAVQIVRVLAETVGFVHRRGILHRDIKPSNILLELLPKSSQATSCAIDDLPFKPKLTDFGLARLNDGLHDRTRSGTVLGTPAYMAPEQASGQRAGIGPGIDIYALGIILYELLIGHPPIQGESDLDTLRRVVEDTVIAPRRLRHDVPRDVEAICLKCLEFDPHRRYRTADHLLIDLTQFLQGHAVTARRVGQVGRFVRWSRRKPVMASLTTALAGSVLVGGFGVVSQWRAAEAQRRVADESFRQAHRAVREFRDILFDSPDFDSPTLQPQRKELVEAALRYHQHFVAQRRDDPQLRADVADANYQLGFMSQTMGQRDQALEYYQAAVPLWETLRRENPGNDDFSYFLAKTHAHIGQLLYQRDSLDAAREEFQIALSIREDQLRADPDDATRQRELAASYHNLAALQRDSQHLESASDFYQRELVLREQSCRGKPDNTQYRRELAELHTSIGSLEKLRGRPEEACKNYMHGRQLLQQLVDDQIGLPWTRHDLAIAEHALGSLHYSTGDTEVALHHLTLADDSFANLVRDYPSVRSFQHGLAENRLLLGNVLSHRGESEEALENLEYAERVLVKLVESDPDNWKGRRNLATVHLGVANTLRKENVFHEQRFHAALTHYETAGRIYAALAAEKPAAADIQRRLASVHRGLGALFLKAGDARNAAGRPKEALQYYRQSQAAYERFASYDETNSIGSKVLEDVHQRITALAPLQAPM